MDKLDKISVGAIILLGICVFLFANSFFVEKERNRKIQQVATTANSAAGNTEIEGKLKLIRNLIDSGSLDKAEMLANELTKKYPYEADTYILIGDMFMRRQDAIKAVHAYKEAIDLNPDYLDKKTSVYQGKKIKVAVAEASENVEKLIKLHPEDQSLKSEKRVIYYLQGKIAGGCA